MHMRSRMVSGLKKDTLCGYASQGVGNLAGLR